MRAMVKKSIRLTPAQISEALKRPGFVNDPLPPGTVVVDKPKRRKIAPGVYDVTYRFTILPEPRK